MLSEAETSPITVYRPMGGRKSRMYYVYILASENNRVLYIGVTNDIIRRIAEHKSGAIEGFTKEHAVNKLVYCEPCNDAYAAITREKQLKGWRREKKVILINQMNPYWKDLSADFTEEV